jgi:uncharacterized SAM-binding protein YcdF (DUF218 family)
MLRPLLTIITFIAFLWTGALVAFVHRIPSEPQDNSEGTADVIVVLTGGELRVAHGFRRLEEGKARILFISGVGRKVKRRELLSAFASPELREAILAEPERLQLDYEASNTQSNAVETARFIHEHAYHSLRLITAGYHMPRSLLECRLLMPDVAIIPDPVLPTAFRRDQWWKDAATRHIVLSEFHKFWAVRFRAWGGLIQ